MLRTGSQETDVISMHKSVSFRCRACTPGDPAPRAAALSYTMASGWSLAVATQAFDPHGQQRVIIQGLNYAQHVAVRCSKLHRRGRQKASV